MRNRKKQTKKLETRIDADVLDAFDAKWKSQGIKSRSKAIKQLIGEYIAPGLVMRKIADGDPL